MTIKTTAGAIGPPAPRAARAQRVDPRRNSPSAVSPAGNRHGRGPRKEFGSARDRGPDRGESKPWHKRDAGSPDHAGRNSRPSRDAAKNFEKRSYDMPRFDKPREDRGGEERPHFSRPREDRPQAHRPEGERPYRERPKFERPRRDGNSE